MSHQCRDSPNVNSSHHQTTGKCVTVAMLSGRATTTAQLGEAYCRGLRRRRFAGPFTALFGQRLLGLVDAPGADFNALWQTLLFERKADLVRFRLESTLRASLALYNTCEELDALVAALWDLRQGRNPGLV